MILYMSKSYKIPVNSLFFLLPEVLNVPQVRQSWSNTSSSRAKQCVRHQLSRDVDHVLPCIVFLGFSFADGGERWLLGITVQHPFDQATLIFGVHCPFKRVWDVGPYAK